MVLKENNSSREYIEETADGEIKSYVSIDSISSREKNKFNDKLKLPELYKQTINLLYCYYFGSTFLHAEAYKLCSISKIWPDFVFHPVNKSYILEFKSIYGDLRKDETGRNLHTQFEEWFTINENRKRVTKKAIEELGLTVERVMEVSG